MAISSATTDVNATRTRFSGSLRDVSIGDLFQTLEMAAKPSEIEFETDVGPATVWFRDRTVIDAECGSATGAAAVYRLAMADDGTFLARFKDSERPPRIQTPPQYLLMEAARRRDEWQERAGEALRPWTRLRAITATSAPEGLSADERELLTALDGEVLLVDLITPGDEARAALFAPIRSLLGRGLLEVIERPLRSATSTHESPTPLMIPEDAPFWVRAMITYVALDPSPRRALLRVLAFGVVLVTTILGLAWWSWRVLVGGQLLGWSLLFVGVALAEFPQVVVVRPLHILVEPLILVADLLDRAGVTVDFVRRGRSLAQPAAR